MRSKLGLLSALVLSFAASVLTVGVATASESGVPAVWRELLLRSTVRIRYERRQNGATITGHGTAFAVDLSRYGYAGRRYLLTAAHNILDDAKRPYESPKVEIDDGSRTYWSRCRVVAWDEDLDLGLVEAADELPRVLNLADSDPEPGSVIIMGGSPRGVPVQLFSGTLYRKFERGTVRSAARIAFDHGDSGGPIVEPQNGTVIGVAVAGIPKDDDLDHDVGLFVPVIGIKSLLEMHRGSAPSRMGIVNAAVAATPPATPLRQKDDQPVRPAIFYGEFLPPAAIAPASAPTAVAPAAAPVASAAKAAPGITVPPAAAAAIKSNPNEYVVQQGDNLTKIAKQLNVTLDALVKANQFKDPNRIWVGARLIVPE